MIQTAPLLDELLGQHMDALGAAWTPYRNHCLRVLNFAVGLSNTESDTVEKLQIALAFHDLAIWTHDTIDYLDPSADLARAWLAEHGKDAWADEIADMITEHHKFTPYRGPQGPLVETLRRADLVDVSLGLVRFGLPRAQVKAVRAAFPNAGFHKTLVKLTGRQLTRDPLHPLPMMKW